MKQQLGSPDVVSLLVLWVMMYFVSVQCNVVSHQCFVCKGAINSQCMSNDPKP